MKRLAFALAVSSLVCSSAFAGDKATPTTKAPATGTMTTTTTTTAAINEPGTNMTCGQLMAHKAALPAKMSELMTSIADNLEAHAKWSGTKDKDAKKEHDAMMKLAKGHRETATTYKKLADEMTAQKDMPGVQHDPKAMDSKKMQEGMTRQIALTREMAQMMMKDADESEKMMKMSATGGSGMTP